MVVDTGRWLPTKFIVAADRLQASTEHKGDFSSDLTKKQIETFPPYNKSDLLSDEMWADYKGRYRSKWNTGPVMHRAETDRNVTPSTQQLQGNPVSSARATNATYRHDAAHAAGTSMKRVAPAGTDSVTIDKAPSELAAGGTRFRRVYTNVARKQWPAVRHARSDLRV